MSNSVRKKRTVLFLAANPKNSTPLRLEEEVREIDEGLQRAKKRDKFHLEQRWAVTHRDFRRAVLELNPQIVHFSGHGVGEEGLVLEDEIGHAQLLRADGLEKLFKLFADQIECVVLNACYSDVQAEAIAHYIPYVIGMKQAGGDRAARKFAVGFYDALGAGKSIEFAYEYGCTSILMAGIVEDLTPVLKKKSDVLFRLPKAIAETIAEPTAKATSEQVQAITDVMFQPGRAVEEQPVESDSVSRSINLPRPAQPLVFDNPEGCVSLDSPFYIERPPIEQHCYAEILRPGALIRIKAPQQMGKTSLLLRILNYAHQHGHQIPIINFQLIDAEDLVNTDRFFWWFCERITEQLDLENQIEHYWKDVTGSKTKCRNYLQHHLLRQCSVPLTIGLDEVDRLFSYDVIGTEVFGLLRTWHEWGRNEEIWRRLRLVIVHSKEVYIPLDINHSPFNVGFSVELPGFTLAQVNDLVQRHRLNWSQQEIDQLRHLLDGHPYLLRKALYEIVRDTYTLEELLTLAPTEAGPFNDHLRRHLLNLQSNPDLVTTMSRVVNATAAVRIEPVEAFKLRSMGLVKLSGNEVVPLCNLYRLYFSNFLGGV
jgi:hypothetical protein